MRASPVLAAGVAVLLAAGPAGSPSPERGRVALRDLVPAGDPLAAQELGFDATFAAEAIEWTRSHGTGLAARMASSPALAHLLAHATNFDYDVPRTSTVALLDALLAPPERETARADICRRSLAFFETEMLAAPAWVGDALRYLPPGFCYHGTLYLTFGYDIGVALAPDASLNCTHPHFAGARRELLYYAIHELHHVGFMSYHRPPRVADLATCADLLRLVEYSTEMEGTAVLASRQRRLDEGALGDDPDYVALDDDARMEADLAAYLADSAYLRARGTEAADAGAWRVIERMSSGERLWYRVGALMARRIEAARGRPALVALVEEGPAAFLAAFRSLGVGSPTAPAELPARPVS